MNHTLLLATMVLSLTPSAHAMDEQKLSMDTARFDTFFVEATKPQKELGQFRDGGKYLNKIRHLYKDAREKKKTLLKIQQILQQRKASGILNHVTVFNKTVQQAVVEIQVDQDEAAKEQVKKNTEKFEYALLDFINEKEKQCEEDVSRIDTVLESKFGMFQNTSFQARKNTWKNTYDSLNILNTTDAEQDAIELLMQKDPVPIGEINTTMEEIQQERGIKIKSNDDDDDDDDDDSFD